MADNLFYDKIATTWEEEGLFARDIEGQLIRLEKATEQDYATILEIEIDGQLIHVPKSVPSTDAQGNFLRDSQGRTVPRRTTIYDAAYKLFGERLRKEAIIPTLCHADHLHPVGVCRVCSVDVTRRERDPKDPTKMRETSSEKLLPACVQPVEPGMVVHTRLSPTNARSRQRVQSALQVLLELLSADHLSSPQAAANTQSELAQLVTKITQHNTTQPINFERFRTGEPPQRAADCSSQVIAVDHSACILCDRCSRACSDIKGNFVIARTGKGYDAHISFDLNDPMGFSSCVDCGECMLSCPTTALTFRKAIETPWYAEELRKPGRSAVSATEFTAIPLVDALPPRWLEWNATSIVKWNVSAGETVCHVGEYGATAFLIASGKYEVLVPRKQEAAKTASWFGSWFGNSKTQLEFRRVDSMTSADIIFGEMSCLSSYPRNATIQCVEAGTLYIIRRNVLFNLQRNPAVRQILNKVYLQRAVFDQVRRIELFNDLSAEDRAACEAILHAEAKLVTLEPGQPVFRQGERPDAFYMVRIGHVKLTETFSGQERILNYLGPNKLFGEIAFILDLPEFAANQQVPEQLRGRRTASAIALDDVELVRVSAVTFRNLLDRFPALRNKCIASAQKILDARTQQRVTTTRPELAPFASQGLYNSQKLLVIDLESCTRCDECTKACSDTHGDITRFIRDGLRFDKYLVASACRSCTDPYCLVGCPVDAIHRNGERLEIRIEEHCIGCGLCANNCPYGNINMVDTAITLRDTHGAKTAVVKHHATTCDLCVSVVAPGSEVSCVYACPHHAAFRMSGSELLAKVEQH